jgi:hypothetical protein
MYIPRGKKPAFPVHFFVASGTLGTLGGGGGREEGAPFPSSYLQGQSRIIQDDIPFHHHLSLIGHLANSCDPDHVVCLQVSLILRVCDLHRILYFWREKRVVGGLSMELSSGILSRTESRWAELAGGSVCCLLFLKLSALRFCAVC